MYLTSAQHKKMYSGGGNRNSYQQQQQQRNNNQQTPSVGSDYGYGGNMNFNFTQGSDSGSFDIASFLTGSSSSSGYSGNVPFYMLPNSNSNSNSNSNYNSGGNGGGGGGRGNRGNSNYNYNYNSNSNSSGNNYSSRQTEYSAAFQTQGYQYNSDDNNANRRNQGGWVKRDSLKRTTPYSGAKGSNMLQKMGWNPGQSLGKRQNGQLEPHMPDIKTNRRGFDVAAQKVSVPMPNKKNAPIGPQVTTINLVTDGKNPISILEEYSSKRKLSPPRYEAIVDEGPVHAKTFVFKVIVDEVEYTTEKGSNVKKQAKAEAARNCLVKLGVLKEPTAV